MVFEGVCRIVCSTYDSDIEPLHQRLASEFLGLELCGTFVVDRAGGLRIQEVVHAEDACKLKMGPMVEGVPHCIRYGLRPFLELLI